MHADTVPIFAAAVAIAVVIVVVVSTQLNQMHVINKKK